MDSIVNLIYSVVIMVLLMELIKHVRGPHVQRKKIIMITFNKNSNIEPVLGLSFGFLVGGIRGDPGAVGQGRNNGGESFQERAQSKCLSLIGHKKITFCAHSEASIYRAVLVIF